MDISEENRLISDILNGNAEAYAVLVNRYQRPIFNLLLRMTGCREEATDLAQDTFLRAYENLEKFRPSRRFFPWLYTIGMNLARDHARKKKSAAKAAELEYQSHHVHIPATSEQQDMAHRLDAARLPELLATLPEDYREAVILRYHEGLAMKEIGQALGISTSGAKMRVKRALARLRDMLQNKSNKLAN
jgi:RNA polymerase sigma-70 factor (ECF subfamily)